ncbi:cysteine synthase A [Acidobacteriota bacterium]
MSIYNNVLELIGNTPMVRLNRIKRDIQTNIIGKLEFYNPSGSVKDRIALAMIEDAETRGLIKKGSIIVEPTSGNTGTSLSLVCALKGYRMIAVMPDQMSQERKDMIAAFGADIELVPSTGGGKPGQFTKDDLEATVAKAEELAAQPGYFMPNQFANPSNTLAHEKTTAEEIWRDTEGKIDAFVAGVGTAGTAMGVSIRLKEKNPNIKCYVVEPANSAVISGKPHGYHRLQGIGEGFIPDLYNHDHADGVIEVSDEEAKATTCRLARMEGIFAGYSSGANVFASLAVARELQFDESHTIVTLIPDTGMKYLSTELYHKSSELCTIHCCNLPGDEKQKECSDGTKSRCCVLEPC